MDKMCKELEKNKNAQMKIFLLGTKQALIPLTGLTWDLPHPLPEALEGLWCMSLDRSWASPAGVSPSRIT